MIKHDKEMGWVLFLCYLLIVNDQIVDQKEKIIF